MNLTWDLKDVRLLSRSNGPSRYLWFVCVCVYVDSGWTLWPLNARKTVKVKWSWLRDAVKCPQCWDNCRHICTVTQSVLKLAITHFFLHCASIFPFGINVFAFSNKTIEICISLFFLSKTHLNAITAWTVKCTSYWWDGYFL